MRRMVENTDFEVESSVLNEDFIGDYSKTLSVYLKGDVPVPSELVGLFGTRMKLIAPDPALLKGGVLPLTMTVDHFRRRRNQGIRPVSMSKDFQVHEIPVSRVSKEMADRLACLMLDIKLEFTDLALAESSAQLRRNREINGMRDEKATEREERALLEVLMARYGVSAKNNDGSGEEKGGIEDVKME